MTNAIAQYGGQTASTYLPGATAANASLLGESLTSNAIDVSSVNATEQGLADSFVNSLPGNSSSLWDSLPSIKDIGSGLGSAFDIFTKAVSGAAAGVGLYKAINPTTPKPLTTTPILTQNPYVTQPPGISGAGASNNPYSSTLKKASTMGDTSQVPGGTPMTGATPQTAIVSGGLNDSAAFPLLALFGLVIYIMHKRG
jgi:hypothetical protein